MRRPIILACVLVVVVLIVAVLWGIGGGGAIPLLHKSAPVSPPTPVPMATLQKKAQKIVAEIEKTCGYLHLDPGEPLKTAPTFFREDDHPAIDSICYAGPSADFDSDRFRFTFRTGDGRLTGYQNGYLIDDLPAAKKYYDVPVKAEWTPDHAIAVADAFRKVLQDPSTAILGPPSAHYSSNGEYVDGPHGTLIKKYQLGQWSITWPRVDSKGRPFYGDHVTIQIQEGYAPLGAGIFLTTPYTEETKAPIAESVALAEAQRLVSWRQLGQKIFFNVVMADEHERNVTGDKVPSKVLGVVIPRKGQWAYADKSLDPPTARLAWVIWFEPIHAAPPSGPTWDDRFSVWIDAYTGEEIGGDAML